MKWLFFYAHPDDESVAAGGTIKMLSDLGDKVVIVYSTWGEAGKIQNNEVLGMSRKKFDNLGGGLKRGLVYEIRKKELEKANSILGVNEYEGLDYGDGDISNKLVWGDLTNTFVELIEKHKPDALVTFDHTGWYFHMDHVGTSLATVKAMEKAKHKVDLLLFNIFHPLGIKSKWKYVYPKKFPTTHKVDISSVRKFKRRALRAHKSQNLILVKSLDEGRLDEELYQLVKSTKKGKGLLGSNKMFAEVK